MLLFGACFVLYFIKLSAGKGFCVHLFCSRTGVMYSGCQKCKSSPIFVKELEIRLYPIYY